MGNIQGLYYCDACRLYTENQYAADHWACCSEHATAMSSSGGGDDDDLEIYDGNVHGEGAAETLATAASQTEAAQANGDPEPMDSDDRSLDDEDDDGCAQGGEGGDFMDEGAQAGNQHVGATGAPEEEQSPGKHPLQEGAFLAPYPSPLDSNPEAKLPLEERSQDQRYYRFFRVGEVIPGASGKDHLRIFHVHSFGSYTEAQMSSLPNSVVEIPDVDEFINLSGRFPSTFLSLFTFMCECDASHRSRWR